MPDWEFTIQPRMLEWKYSLSHNSQRVFPADLHWVGEKAQVGAKGQKKQTAALSLYIYISLSLTKWGTSREKWKNLEEMGQATLCETAVGNLVQ